MKAKTKSVIKIASEPVFIRPLESDGDQVQISFRIAGSEKSRFDAAQSVLRSHGKDMLIAEVLRAAMREASEYVEKMYGNMPINKNSDGSEAGKESVVSA